MTNPNLETEAAAAPELPASRFGARERKLLASVKDYADSKVADGAVPLSALSSTATFTHRVVAAGKHTTAGGDATESIVAAAVTASDVVLVTVQTAGAIPRTVVSAVPGTGSIAVTLSDDPSTDHILSYVVLRVAS